MTQIGDRPPREVIVSFDVDAEAAVLGMGLDLDLRPSLRSHQAYGPEVGVPRLLEVLRSAGVRATFFMPGRTVELHSETAEEILKAGHEIAHHGYEHRPPFTLEEAEERTELERGLEALARFQVRPLGYRAPWWELSPRSLGLLREYGFRYDSSLFDRDGPYALAGVPTLVEIPVSWALDDWERYAFWPDLYGSGIIGRPSEVEEAWYEEVVQTLHAGGTPVLTMHPFLSGRPSRAAALARLLERIGQLPGVRFVTCADAANGVAQDGQARAAATISREQGG
jgi:peptidoglycan/xylan/chitin deacetylase (PgdA/CDA1 family)